MKSAGSLIVRFRNVFVLSCVRGYDVYLSEARCHEDPPNKGLDLALCVGDFTPVQSRQRTSL